ncbi:MAG: hypothetical protein AB7F43_04225 [Bacteriovoracia bacterium]
MKTHFYRAYLPSWVFFVPLLFLSCSHTKVEPIPPQDSQDIAAKIREEHDLGIELEVVNAEIKRVGAILKKKHWSRQEITFLERFMKKYILLQNSISEASLKVPPFTAIRVELGSFCLNPESASPSSFELFDLQLENPGIRYFSKIIRFIGEVGEASENKVQELLWNLKWETYYENYPDYLKKLLLEIDLSAPIFLPSMKRERVKDIIKQSVPGAQEVDDITNLARGVYHDYESFRELIEQKKSSFEENENENVLRPVPGRSGLYLKTQSNGFSKQILTFYNTTNTSQSIDFSQSFLQPVRQDVQAIGVYINLNARKAILDKVYSFLIRTLSKLYPTVTKKERELIEKDPLTSFRVFLLARDAERSAEKCVGGNCVNDSCDAFRHFVWAGLLTREFGEETARHYLNAHEDGPGKREDREMDIFNNEKGIEGAKGLRNNFSQEELESLGLEWVRKKILQLEPRKDFP